MSISPKKNDTFKMATATAGALITLKELAQRLQMHPDTVRGLWRRRQLPGLVIGHRTLRFNWDEVLTAIKRGDAAGPNK